MAVDKAVADRADTAAEQVEPAAGTVAVGRLDTASAWALALVLAAAVAADTEDSVGTGSAVGDKQDNMKWENTSVL